MPLSSFTEEARRLVDSAGPDKITLRVMGATAIRIHCPRFSCLHEALLREISDIDFMALSSEKDSVLDFLLRMGYQFDRRRVMIMRYLKIRLLEEEIEKVPKSMGWKMRAKIGPRQQWYREVEEVERGPNT